MTGKLNPNTQSETLNKCYFIHQKSQTFNIFNHAMTQMGIIVNEAQCYTQLEILVNSKLMFFMVVVINAVI
jgi:hypothetical protein